MNERIRKLAEQAGFRSDVTVTDGNNKRIDTKTSIALERFAALIRETEREDCAQLCENLVIAHPDRADLTAQQCANAIRLRSVSDESYLMLRREPPYKEGVWDQQVIR
jgi:hypothetical protein